MARLAQRRRLATGGPDLLTWTIVHRRYLKPDGMFDLVEHPYLVDIYRLGARVIVLYKASQMGASEYGISYVLHAGDCRKATSLYVFPTDKHVSDFSSARLGPAIEASQHLASIVVEGRALGGKRGADRVTLKRVRDRFLYLLGAQVGTKGEAHQLKSVDADVLVLDEVDEMDPRAPEIAEKRLGHSLIGEQRWISTPSYPGIGIHAAWLETDQREWFVRCRGCGEWQPLSIDLVVMEWDDLGRPVTWHGQDPERAHTWVRPNRADSVGNGAYAACRKCGAELERCSGGRWVATYPGRERVGFHLTKLFSARADLLAIVHKLQTTDETRRKECYNQDLGLPYAPKGGKLSDHELDDCRREYAQRPVGGELTVMGVDVGKVMYGAIRGPRDPVNGERPLRWAGEMLTFEDVGRQMARFQVEKLVIDALPETRKARELQQSWPQGTVWLAYYVTQKVGSKRATPVQWNDREYTVDLDRTRTLDLTMSRFFSGENTLPADAREITAYYDQLTSPTRVIEDGPGGEKVARYVESGADHYAHAENYCTVAGLDAAGKMSSEDVEDFGGYGGL